MDLEDKMSMNDSMKSPGINFKRFDQSKTTDMENGTERIVPSKSPIEVENDQSHFFNLDQSELEMLEKLAQSENGDNKSYK